MEANREGLIDLGQRDAAHRAFTYTCSTQAAPDAWAASTGANDHHQHLDRRISYADVGADEYDGNIQTAILKMLNAAMAVLKWRTLGGNYVDSKHEYNSQFTVARNKLHNGGVAD